MRQLPPFRLREKYFGAIEAEIQRIFNDILFKRLAALILKKEPEEILNALTALLAAIRSGAVWYEDAQFKGQFSARISKELKAIGATYNKKSGSWSLAPRQLPTDVKFAQADADNKIRNLRAEVITALDSIDAAMVEKVSKAPTEYSRSIEWMESDFQKATAAITIVPKLSPTMLKTISQEWGKNLDLYIKGWLDENIIKLRTKVKAHALAGGRAEGLVKMLQENYGVSKSKARFLARQETSLLMSKFAESRYADIGIKKYRWSTSNDERVRHDHKILDGKIFSFDSPPITNRKTGARNNPGEDFECRCVAIPVL